MRQWHSIASDAQWDATICIILWTIIYCDIYMRRTYPIRYMLTKRLPHWIFFSILHYEPHNYYSISDTTNANLRIKYTLIIICTKLQTQQRVRLKKNMHHTYGEHDLFVALTWNSKANTGFIFLLLFTWPSEANINRDFPVFVQVTLSVKHMPCLSVTLQCLCKSNKDHYFFRLCRWFLRANTDRDIRWTSREITHNAGLYN